MPAKMIDTTCCECGDAFTACVLSSVPDDTPVKCPSCSPDIKAAITATLKEHGIPQKYIDDIEATYFKV